MRQAAARADQHNGSTLYEEIGEFLAAHRLSPEPAHYTFAWTVLTQPQSALARAVGALTDGGVRLVKQDLERLGAAMASPASAAAAPPKSAELDKAIAQAQRQVEGFASLVRGVHDETREFGRDLEASATACALADGAELSRLATAMVARVAAAETKLATANKEAGHLRSALDDARGDARRDPLTELANRRAFEEAVAAMPAGTRAAVGICDVDFFKRVNDRFGHPAGDRVLRGIAQMLAEHCRPYLVARYGGEEFAVLFAECDVTAAADTLDAARKAIRTRRMKLRESDAPLGAITFSAGVASFVAGEDLAEAIAAADEALYRAKRGGRDRVEIAPEIGG